MCVAQIVKVRTSQIITIHIGEYKGRSGEFA